MPLGVYLLLILYVAGRVSGAPFFAIVEVKTPPGYSAEAVDLNDADEMVGTLVSNDVRRVFYWKNDLKVLPSFGDSSFPAAINNLGEIVGNGLTNGGWRPWLYRNGQYEELRGNWVADRNDAGDIIGIIDGEGYVISAEPPVWLTGPTGGPNGPCNSISLAAINNARTVIGKLCGSGIASENFSPLQQAKLLWPVWPIAVSGDANPTALNETGLIVGDIRFHYSTSQAALWIGNDWRELGAPLENPSYALGVNSTGVIVGSQWNGPALLWNTNGVGYDLNTLADIPEGRWLVAATAVNARGEIAANANANQGETRAVLLRPLASFSTLPQFKIMEPFFGSVLHTNDARVSITEFGNAELSSGGLSNVIYRLYSRSRSDPQGGGDFWVPTSYSSNPVRTNRAIEPPYSTVFTNLLPGQYVVMVEVNAVKGVRVYTQPIRFAVAREAVLTANRPNFDGEFVFGLNGSPGLVHAIEVSSDLMNWREFVAGTEGGNFTDQATTNNRSFYRARVAYEDPLSFGRSPMNLSAPASIETATLSLWAPQNAGTLTIQLNGGTFTGQAYASYVALFGDLEWEGNYKYEAGADSGRLTLVDPRPPSVELELELEFPLTFSPFGGNGGHFRGNVIVEDGRRTDFSGTFILSFH